MKMLSVSDKTYNRLASHAAGFETPESVIERLLDAYEIDTDPGSKPKLTFIPENEEEFKDRLVESGRAYVELRMEDGSIEAGDWKVHSFKKTSNLRANIWSGYLRNWGKRGIVSATFEVVHSPDSSDKIVLSAQYQMYVINQHASGSITVKVNGMDARPVRPNLRTIAEVLGVSITNSNGNDLNTRQLGAALIKAINTQ
ncbi:hypothetical protein EDF81_2205 [Enterobacter sp. BIGb0383]|uniref:hypothetical protein n=1 Tax=unclassified Enterobacter TaxID=2608935 RepID=UPI000F497AC4|nr:MULTISPECIES: hypothetical protein [unclassified Enterobacter]ROP59403.1 hypothetical protein EDF81_2205 [Enterobacter sp. BIGb0383]ROS09131.1 hypothetical protein EC848_2637 [Enterobacter sp. BIGb0359]